VGENGRYGFKIAGIGIGLSVAVSQLMVANLLISASVALGTLLFAIGSIVIWKSAAQVGA